MPRQRACIYCGETKTWPREFTREHVLSDAAGSFNNNLSKLRCVCKACNSHFGEALEAAFFWGTMEGYLRLYEGLRPAERVANLAHGRLTFSLDVPGPWNGVRLTADHEDGQVVIGLVPQVGFETLDPPGWVYVTRDQLASDALLPPAASPAVRMKLIVPSEDVEHEIVELLARRGIPFSAQGPMPPPPTDQRQVPTTIQTPIDDVVRRYIAKLAFNYLAHAVGDDFLLQSCFDPIRKFVRYGVAPRWRFFSITDRPPLSDETKTGPQTRGHVLAVHWPRQSDEILAQVRLFNGPTYRLVLAQHVRELWRPITRGHLFNPYTRRTSRLTSFEATTATVRSRSGIVTRVPIIRPW